MAKPVNVFRGTMGVTGLVLDESFMVVKNLDGHNLDLLDLHGG